MRAKRDETKWTAWTLIMLLVLLALVAVIVRELPRALAVDADFYSNRQQGQQAECRLAQETVK